MKRLLLAIAIAFVIGAGLWWSFRRSLPQWLGGRVASSTNTVTPATAEQELQQRAQQASEVQQLKHARDTRRMTDILSLQTALESYKNSHAEKYPQSLLELVPTYAGSIPTDPGSGTQYVYGSVAGGSAYTMTYTLEYGVDNLTAGQHTAVPGNVASQ